MLATFQGRSLHVYMLCRSCRDCLPLKLSMHTIEVSFLIMLH